MPKYRQLHLKILDSNDLNDMPDDFTRLSWVLLSCIMDSAGRGNDNEAWVRSKMYPLRKDVTLEMVCAALDWFANNGMIVRYSSGGRKYFYIPTWELYQSGTDKEAPSSIPDPELLPTNSGATPDLLPPKAMLQGNASTNATRQEEQGNARDDFEVMQRMIERLTGCLMGQKDIAAINELIKGEITEADLREAMAFLKGKKIVRGAADLLKSALVAHAKRIQAGSNGNGAKHIIGTDARGKAIEA